jgi:hypothetical protein
MLPILKKAVTSFTLLRAEFSKLTEFFVNAASLLRDVLSPSVDSFAKAVTNTQKLGGVTWGEVTRGFIYAQMMVPLRASMLANKVAVTYLQVNEEYIVPAQKTVSGMLRFNHDDTEEGKRKFRGKREVDREKYVLIIVV